MARPACWIGILFGLLVSYDGAAAQDAHYWNLQYGTRGELLGGVVVGSAVDLSATYYNPGALAIVTNPSTILTANVFQLQRIRVVDETPSEEPLVSDNFGPAPSIFAGLLPFELFGGKVAYSFLTRQTLKIHMEAAEAAVIGRDAQGDTLSIGGEVLLTQDLAESWGGLTWSKKLGNDTGVGATIYGAYRSQDRRVQSEEVALGADGFGAGLLDISQVDFYTFGVLAKVGAVTTIAHTRVGVALTTPRAELFGNGNIGSQTVITGDVNADGVSDAQAQIAHGENLNVTFKSPVSVALGASHTWGRYTLHATAEWFQSVEDYTVVEASAPPPSPGVTGYPLAYQCQLEEVVNWGVGLEKAFSERGTAYISFATDRCANPEFDWQQIALTTWDIYQLNGGVALTIGGTDLTIGGGYSWGKEPFNVTGTAVGLLPPTVIPSSVEYQRLKFILGFAL